MGIRIGILPFYLKLYDDTSPRLRRKVETFYKTIAGTFEEMNVSVIQSPVCRIRSEFEEAIQTFISSSVDAIVTLHLAYSPSLESIEPIIASQLPIVILDTTPDYMFGPEQSPDRISFNHGIHGVQDLCSLLVRNNYPFFIEAGHWQQSDVMLRVVHRVRGIKAARSLRGMNIGIIGDPFYGMGDFQVSYDVLENIIGIKTIQFTQRSVGEISQNEFIREKEYLETTGEIRTVPEKILKENIRITKGIRSWLKEEKLSGFTCNFLQVTRDTAVDRVPFLAASVGMYEGYGYAGEGDVLTSALVSALLGINKKTSFTEMFCPDWEEGRIFLSHMGEVNPRTCSPRVRYVVKDYHYSDSDQPIYSVGQFASGSAHLVNLVPLAGNQFRLIVAPIEMLSYDHTSFSDTVHGWFRPAALPLIDFLQQYSQLGGTHHSAIVYDESVEVLKTFGTTAGWDVQIIA